MAEPTADELAAAEWAAALEAEEKAKAGEPAAPAAAPASADGAPQRILNQDEIDSLLGFDTKKEGGKQTDKPEGIFAPRMPINRVMCVLKKIGRLLINKSVSIFKLISHKFRAYTFPSTLAIFSIHKF